MDAVGFARLLGLLGVVAAETSEPQDAYLAACAGMVRDACGGSGRAAASRASPRLSEARETVRRGDAW